MNPIRWLAAIVAAVSLSAAEPKLKGVHDAMESMIRSNEVAGAVTVVVTKDKTLHLDSAGFSDGDEDVSLLPLWNGRVDPLYESRVRADARANQSSLMRKVRIPIVPG